MASIGDKEYLYGGASRSICSDAWGCIVCIHGVKTQSQGIPAMGHSFLVNLPDQ